MHATAKGIMTQKMLVPLIPEEASPSGTHSGAYTSVEVLVLVSVVPKGGTRAGGLLELADSEDTGEDKSKRHKRKPPMSKTLRCIWHIVSSISSKSLTEQSGGGHQGGSQQVETVELF